jgi:hypothetical protein
MECLGPASQTEIPGQSTEIEGSIQYSAVGQRGRRRRRGKGNR